jgi:hypothetical protein
MLSQAFTSHLTPVLHGLISSPTAIAMAILLSSIMIWRLWKFTVVPVFYPERVRELPYWIPCKLISATMEAEPSLLNQYTVVGHSFSYFKDAPAVVNAGL